MTRSDGMVHKISTVIRRTVVVRKTFLARSPGALKQIVLGLRASRRVTGRECKGASGLGLGGRGADKDK